MLIKLSAYGVVPRAADETDPLLYPLRSWQLEGESAHIWGTQGSI